MNEASRHSRFRLFLGADHSVDLFVMAYFKTEELESKNLASERRYLSLLNCSLNSPSSSILNSSTFEYFAGPLSTCCLYAFKHYDLSLGGRDIPISATEHDPILGDDCESGRGKLCTGLRYANQGRGSCWISLWTMIYLLLPDPHRRRKVLTMLVFDWYRVDSSKNSTSRVEERVALIYAGTADEWHGDSILLK